MEGIERDIIIRSLRDASARIRRLFLANLTLCAVVFSIFYTNSLAHERILSGHAFFYEQVFDRIISDIKETNNHKKFLELEPEDQDKISNLELSKYTAQNTYKESVFSKAELPFIGISEYSTTIAILASALMLVFSVWLIFTSHQIADFFVEPNSKKFLINLNGTHRHLFATIYSTKHRVLSYLLDIIIYLPCIIVSLMINSVCDAISGYSNFAAANNIDEHFSNKMLISLEREFYIYWTIAFLLLVSGVIVFRQWQYVTNIPLKKDR